MVSIFEVPIEMEVQLDRAAVEVQT